MNLYSLPDITAVAPVKL